MSQPLLYDQLSTFVKGISLSVWPPPGRSLSNVQSCRQPAKAPRAIYSKVGGVRTSRSKVHLKKASRPILRNLLERLSCCKCKQSAKVDPKI